MNAYLSSSPLRHHQPSPGLQRIPTSPITPHFPKAIQKSPSLSSSSSSSSPSSSPPRSLLPPRSKNHFNPDNPTVQHLLLHNHEYQLIESYFAKCHIPGIGASQFGPATINHIREHTLIHNNQLLLAERCKIIGYLPVEVMLFFTGEEKTIMDIKPDQEYMYVHSGKDFAQTFQPNTTGLIETTTPKGWLKAVDDNGNGWIWWEDNGVPACLMIKNDGKTVQSRKFMNQWLLAMAVGQYKQAVETQGSRWNQAWKAIIARAVKRNNEKLAMEEGRSLAMQVMEVRNQEQDVIDLTKDDSEDQQQLLPPHLNVLETAQVNNQLYTQMRSTNSPHRPHFNPITPRRRLPADNIHTYSRSLPLSSRRLDFGDLGQNSFHLSPQLLVRNPDHHHNLSSPSPHPRIRECNTPRSFPYHEHHQNHQILQYQQSQMQPGIAQNGYTMNMQDLLRNRLEETRKAIEGG